MKNRLLLVICVSLIVTMFVGCSPKEEEKAVEEVIEEPSLFTAGTFQGTGEGFKGEIILDVEVDEDSILSITVVEMHETQGISDGAFIDVPAAIIENQSVAVDTVSGATFASKGIIEAVTDAISKTAIDMTVIGVIVE